MSNATRDSILAGTKRRFKDVTLWDGSSARIRSLTAAEWAEIDSKTIDMKKGGLSASGVKASDLRLFAATVCDGDGNPLFQESDIPALGSLDAALVIPVVKEIRDHCGLRQTTEDALKNSAPTGG